MIPCRKTAHVFFCYEKQMEYFFDQKLGDRYLSDIIMSGIRIFASRWKSLSSTAKNRTDTDKEKKNVRFFSSFWHKLCPAPSPLRKWLVINWTTSSRYHSVRPPKCEALVGGNPSINFGIFSRQQGRGEITVSSGLEGRQKGLYSWSVLGGFNCILSAMCFACCDKQTPSSCLYSFVRD